MLIQLYRLLAPWRLPAPPHGSRRHRVHRREPGAASTSPLRPSTTASSRATSGRFRRGAGRARGGGALYSLTATAQTYASAWIAQRALASLRSRLRPPPGLSPGFYDRSQTGDLVSRLTNDVEQLENLVSGALVSMSGSLLALVGTLVAMFVLDAELALIALWVFPASFVAMAVWGRLARPRFRRTRDTIGAVSRATCRRHSAASRSSAVRPGAAPPRRLAGLNATDGQAQMAIKRIAFGFSGVMTLLPSIGVTVILIVGGLQVSTGDLQVGVVAIIAYFQRLFGPLTQLTNLASLYSQGGAALDKINALLDEKPRSWRTPGRRPLARGPGEVRIEGVTFSYDGKRDGDRGRGHHLPGGKDHGHRRPQRRRQASWSA